jgi:hypothetical protein
VRRAHQARALRLARLVEDELVRCGWAGSGLTTQAGRDIRAALDAMRPIVVDIDHRGLTPAGELRHPVVKACGWGSRPHDAGCPEPVLTLRRGLFRLWIALTEADFRKPLTHATMDAQSRCSSYDPCASS